MTSYFDHFIVVQFFIFSDYFFVLLFLVMVFMTMLGKINMIPYKIQLSIELIMDHLSELITQNLGEFGSFYLLVFLVLFMGLVGANLFGFFLFSIPVTTHMSLTFGLSISFWLGTIFYGVKNFGSNFFSMFMPLGAPMGMSFLLVGVEVASHFSSPVALGMRLAANLTAGHILLSMLSDFGCKMLMFSSSVLNLFPSMMIMFMVSLETAVLVIQAYVFCLLLLIYLKDSLMLH